MDNSLPVVRNINHKYIVVGGDSRYAILFRCPTDIIDMKFAMSENDERSITPAGYQPLQRCTAQHGYLMNCPNANYDLKKDAAFEKYRFKLTAEFCEKIYNMNEGGNLIYPDSDITGLEKYIKAINTTTVFSKKCFNEFIKTLGAYDEHSSFYENKSRTMAIEMCLAKRGVFIRNNANRIPDEVLREMNKSYPAEYVTSQMNVDSKISPIFSI